MRLRVQVAGGRELARQLDRLDDVAAGKALETAVVSGALLIMNAAKEKAPVKTGNLRRSIHVGGHTGLQQPTTGSDIGGNRTTRRSATVAVGTNVEYAAIQEFGGTITPRNARALAIPLTNQARAHAPRQFPGELHVAGRGGRRAVLADESDTPQYALVHQVTIPAKPYLRPALDENRDAVEREVGDALRVLLARVTR